MIEAGDPDRRHASNATSSGETVAIDLSEPTRPWSDGGALDALGDEIVERSVEVAADWLRRAHADVEREEQATADRLLGIIGDRNGVAFTMAFVDRVARHRNDAAGARELASLVRGRPLPRFLSWFDRLALRAGAVVAPTMPRLAMPLARRRMRQLVGHLVVDADPAAMHDHLDEQRRAGFALNVNLLGEMVLGEDEARRRYDQTRALIDDPHVDYVSIKVSALASQLDLWSFDVTLARIVERLGDLFRAAATSSPPTFVNLDMEEYADLELTIAAFTQLLDEPELVQLPAGIVLQAYLPDALGALERLTGWATARCERGGAPIKIRIVKGANLAMERVDAELHGWRQAPYESKADVDANYKRCIDWALTPERTAAVCIGVASHNLFDVAWAHLLAEGRGVADRVQFEMLQGIAPSQARAVRSDADGLLLYTPVVGRRDFDIAIAYLFRRLEENAAPENFLRHLFTLRPGSPEFDEQADRFREAVASRWTVPAEPRRAAKTPTATTDVFDNEPDTDPSLDETQRWISELRLRRPDPLVAPMSTDVADVDAAIDRARAAQPAWFDSGAAARSTILRRAADELASRRGELLVTMAHEGRKTFAEADPEVSEAIDFARWYADLATELDEDHDGAAFRPFGVVAVVPPWNFPVAIPAGGVLGALAAGNAVVFKPAQETPRCAEIVAEALWAAGVPRDVLQFVRTPDDDVGQRLVTAADAVILTGSWETANLFRSWRPDMRLFAETSGKNAVVVTPRADLDLAADDVVRSAFGHSGQKCSAASLAILVGDTHDDERFRAKLVDAARSLRVGWPTEPGTTFGPVITPASDKLLDALTTLGPGERWLLEPSCLDDAGSLWSPGIKDGVSEGSSFHQTECFGPVLGLMRAGDLLDAIRIQNDVPFGLTGGVQSLDPGEIDDWLERVEVGNAYVNRHITGAIVRRQPFGGWKRSSIGPGAKAGGPDYLLQLGTWVEPDGASTDPAWLSRAAASDERWWAAQYGRDHDPSALACEANILRYRPRPGVVVRASAGASAVEVERTLRAARQAAVEPTVSHASVDDDPTFVAELSRHRGGRVRVVGTVPAGLGEAAVEAEVDVVDAPVVASGRLELRWYVREQSISRTLHRFGNLIADR